MTAKDQKLIEANPGKTAYQLLELGLSQKGFTELSGMQQTARTAPTYTPKNELIPEKVELTAKHIAQPVLMPHVAAINVSDTVQLYNKKTGKTTSIQRVNAQKMARKYPNEFQIL